MASDTVLDINKLTHKWIGFDIPKCRPCGGTYHCYDGTTLPPLEETFPNQFAWIQDMGSAQTDPFNISNTLSQPVLQHCPADFVTFMKTEDWLNKTSSPTACYFVLEETRLGQGALVEFYRDQQSCCHWYLWIDLSSQTTQPAPILTSWDDGETLSFMEETELYENLHVAEASLERFLYRLYLENELWFELNNMKPAPILFLPEVKQHYCDFLKKIDFQIKSLFDF